MTASGLIRGTLLVCGLLLTAACSAHDDNSTATATAVAPVATEAGAPASAASTHFTAGDQYVNFKLPTGQAAPSGPIEMVEVFSYGCPHCAEFAPYMDRLRVEIPKRVEVRSMPAVFNASWVPYAQAFYAARQLGVLKQTHDALFKAMLQHYPLNSLDDLAVFYARHGVNKQKFLAAATNAKTMSQMAADQRTELDWGIDRTPTLVVGRRANSAEHAPFIALMRSANVTSYGELQQLGLWMAQHIEQR